MTIFEVLNFTTNGGFMLNLELGEKSFSRKHNLVQALSNRRDFKNVKILSRNSLERCTCELNISNNLSNILESSKISENIKKQAIENPDSFTQNDIAKLSWGDLNYLNTPEIIKVVSERNPKLHRMIKQTTPLKSTFNISAGAFVLRKFGIGKKLQRELKNSENCEPILDMVYSNNFNFGTKGYFLSPILKFLGSTDGLKTIMLNSMRVESIKNKLLENGTINDPIVFARNLVFLTDNYKRESFIKSENGFSLEVINFLKGLTNILLDKKFRVS